MLKKVAGVLVALAPAASFAAQDYSGIATSVTGEVTAAVTAGLPIFGSVVAIFVGIRILRRLVKG
jgi:hypothetical protein